MGVDLLRSSIKSEISKTFSLGNNHQIVQLRALEQDQMEESAKNILEYFLKSEQCLLKYCIVHKGPLINASNFSFLPEKPNAF